MPIQGVTSLALVGHESSVKNWHSRGWRLLDRKKSATTVEMRVLEKTSRSEQI